MGHGAWGMGHGAWGMGHWAWGMGHGAWGIGHWAYLTFLRTAIYNLYQLEIKNTAYSRIMKYTQKPGFFTNLASLLILFKKPGFFVICLHGICYNIMCGKLSIIKVVCSKDFSLY